MTSALVPCTTHAIECCMVCMIDEFVGAPRVYKNQIRDIDAARAKHPEAFVMFDSQLDDLAQLPCEFRYTRKGKIQVRFHDDLGNMFHTANWHADACVWVRATAVFKSTPYVATSSHKIRGLTYDLIIIDDCVGYTTPE